MRHEGSVYCLRLVVEPLDLVHGRDGDLVDDCGGQVADDGEEDPVVVDLTEASRIFSCLVSFITKTCRCYSRMSSLFEKCAYCGNEVPGFLFCSDTCRLAALPSSKCEAKRSIDNNPAPAPGARDLTPSLMVWRLWGLFQQILLPRRQKTVGVSSHNMKISLTENREERSTSKVMWLPVTVNAMCSLTSRFCYSLISRFCYASFVSGVFST